MIALLSLPRRALAALGLLFVISLPFVMGIAQTLLATRDPFFAYGDDALIDVAVRNATRFDQLLGPYSRFGWNHPGPLSFYLLAPFYALVDGPLRIYLGALFVNWMVALACVVLAVRRGGLAVGAAVTATLGLLLLAEGPEFLRSPWNPAMIVLPLFLAVIAVAIRPTAVTLALGVAGASLAVQAHVSTAAIVVVLAGILIASHVGARVRPSLTWLSPDSNGRLLPSGRSIAVVGAVALICWLPPLIEQLTSRPGNLRALASFFVRAGGHHSIEESARHLAAATWLPIAPYITFEEQAPVDGRIYLVLLTVIGVALAVVAWRRRSRSALLPAAFTAVATPVSLLSLTRADGEIVPYLLWWAPLLVTSSILAAAVLVAERLSSGMSRRSQAGAVLAAFTVLTVAIGATTVAGRPISGISRAEVGEAWSELQPRLPDNRVTVLLDLRDGEVSDVMAGIAVQLEDNGYAVEVPPSLKPIYGESRDSQRRVPDLIVTFARTGSPNDTPATADVIRAGPGDRTAIRVLQASRQPA